MLRNPIGVIIDERMGMDAKKMKKTSSMNLGLEGANDCSGWSREFHCCNQVVIL